MSGEREIRPKWPAIYTFLGRGKQWQKSNNLSVRCSRMVGVWCLIIRNCRTSIVKIGWCLTVVGVWQFISDPFLLACSMLFASISHPLCILFGSTLLPASCCLLCGWDCFHVLMTNHHMPVSNMFHSTNTNIICCYCFEFCHHLSLPMYWPLGSDSSFSYPVLVHSGAQQPDEQSLKGRYH
jgi:hypothetical protein